MPLKDYKCNKCDKIEEKFFSLGEDIPQELPCSCGNNGTLTKQVNASAIHFVGTGWPTADERKHKY